MAVYTYKAMDAQGRLILGRMDALNPVDLEMRLKRMDLDFITGEPVKNRSTLLGGRIPRRELINFCFHLEQLVRAGVPILEALSDLRDTVADPRMRAAMAGLVEDIEGGKTLSQAMGDRPRIFNAVFANLVRAGELSGRLPEVLRNLADSLKWEDELASHTKKLVTYPALVGTVVVGVTLFLMVYLVPQMAGFIRNMGQELPMQTVALMAFSHALTNYWYLFVGLPLLAVAGLRAALYFDPGARLQWDGFKLRVPLFGPILNKIILSRFATVFAMLYASGIAVIDAVRTTEDVVGNRAVRQALRRAGNLIAEGQNLTSAFQSVGLFPPLVLRMLRVGENTGGLDTALANVSYFYNRDVKESVERLQAVAEPALTVVLGLLLMWVMLSVLGPIYDVITRLKI
ncbi:MAG: type II secretion system F family protein [Rhodocyclaceae bacterium]